MTTDAVSTYMIFVEEMTKRQKAFIKQQAIAIPSSLTYRKALIKYGAIEKETVDGLSSSGVHASVLNVAGRIVYLSDLAIKNNAMPSLPGSAKQKHPTRLVQAIFLRCATEESKIPLTEERRQKVIEILLFSKYSCLLDTYWGRLVREYAENQYTIHHQRWNVQKSNCHLEQTAKTTEELFEQIKQEVDDPLYESELVQDTLLKTLC